ncbi:alpha/beta hydrolase [Agathobaculum sp. TL06]
MNRIPLHKDWQSKTQYIDLPTGIRMYYMESGDPQAEPLLLIHGLCDSSRIWRRLMCELGDKYHIFAIDCRGAGQTDKPKEFAYMPAEHALDIAAFLDAVQVRSAYVLAHSMGTMIAQALAFTAPERVQKLFMAAPMVRGLDDAAALHAQYDQYETMDTASMPQKRLQELFLPYPENCRDPEFPDGFFTTLRGTPAWAIRAAWFGANMADHRNFVQFIQAPVMMIWGNRDTVLGETYQKEVRACFPHAPYLVMDGISHEIPNEMPEKLAALATTFFAQK